MLSDKTDKKYTNQKSHFFEAMACFMLNDMTYLYCIIIFEK